jgi:hypothetical protein
MNKYYCTKCNIESVVFGKDITSMLLCKCSDVPTPHRRSDYRDKPNPTAVTPKQVAKEVPLVVEVPAAKPQTKLDVSSGAVKGAKV